MVSGRRFRTVLVLLGVFLTVGTARAEPKASGGWKDPPIKPDTPATNATAMPPVSTPASVDGAAPSARAANRPARPTAKLRRKQIRATASRPRVERTAAVPAPRTVASWPKPRFVARAVVRSRHVSVPAPGWRPVYGYIEPGAPAAAYYDRRRLGTVGMAPAELGLRPGEAFVYRSTRMPTDGRLIVRWRGDARPTDTGFDGYSSFDED